MPSIIKYRLTITLFIFQIMLFSVQAQSIITTVAGNGTQGFSGDGGPATAAELWVPDGIFIDAIGNLYVADGDNNRKRKVDVSGIITTIAGNGTQGYSGDGGQATAAALNNQVQ